MKLLLDTHALLWFLINDNQLPSHIRTLIEAPTNDVATSIASYWEIGIKQKHGKGDLPWVASVPALEHLAIAEQIDTLSITTDAIEQTKQFALDHRDPFDRMIAACAVTYGMRLVSSDAQMDLFVRDRLW